MPETVLLETQPSQNCSAVIADVSSKTTNIPTKEIKILFNLKRTQKNSTLDHNQHQSQTTQAHHEQVKVLKKNLQIS